MFIPRSALTRALTISVAAVTPVAVVVVAAAPAGAVPALVADDFRGQDAVAVALQTLGAMQRGDGISYAALRQRLASLVGPAAGVDPAQLDAVWTAADGRRMVAVVSALTQLRVPYHRMGATPGQSFDCSGLTSWAWAQSGVVLPHQSGRQIRGVAQVSLAEVQPGDLLYYPGHVMLALGVGGAIIHAPNSGSVVQIRMLSERQQRRVRVGDPLA